ncbi:MAG: hypothetical protein ACOYJZ_06570 [Acutalibacter sp.]|jgi:hypothetical protein
MKEKRPGPSLGPWDAAALVLAGLLYLAVLTVLILTLAGVGVLVTALEAGVFTGVLLLLGMAVYFLAKSRGIGRLARRLLLGALWAGGGMLALFCVALGILMTSAAGL